jgi:anti-sigma regulatory factor (Ser/Thr protein kinase)
VPVKRHFERSLVSLEDVFLMIDDFVKDNTVDPETAFAMNLAAEEIFVNMVKHNPQGTEDISIELDLQEDRIVLHLTDHDSGPFDLAEAEETDETVSDKELMPGGRGLQLVRSLMDRVEYQQDGRIGRIILTKLLGNSDV